MKFFYLLTLLTLLACNGTAQAQTPAEAGQHKVHHLVIIWLKQTGDLQARQKYMDESRELSKLPGVLTYDIGTPATIKRERLNAALVENYDIAIASTYENQQAYEAFLKNPQYVKLAQDVLRPLVEKYQVFDFVE